MINNWKEITEVVNSWTTATGHERRPSWLNSEPLTLQQDRRLRCSLRLPAPGSARPMETWSRGAAERITGSQSCGEHRRAQPRRLPFQAGVSSTHSPTCRTLSTLVLTRWRWDPRVCARAAQLVSHRLLPVTPSQRSTG